MSVAIDSSLARDAVNTIKFLAVDAVEKANSGHPGMPMGAADMAFVLWSRFLRYDPTAPDWPDRDRFVLSAGHGCMLLYSLLHLSGYDLSMSELQAFRQWESKTPGHPEFGHTVGVEATTGPLGQGISNAVGMATAAKMMAARFNTDDFNPITHRIFVIASDGDLMEGVSGEASSLAGHLGLGNLVVLYDDNQITIEGKTDLAFSEEVGERYGGYGWHVQHASGHDHEAVEGALEAAIGETARPSIIICRTHIAAGAPNAQDTADAHGAPLGADEIKATKEALGWPQEPTFHVPEAVQSYFRSRSEEGTALRTAWEERFAAWSKGHPDLAQQWKTIWNREVPADLTAQLLAAAPTDTNATRSHSGAVIQKAAELVPSLIGGSADLAPSTKTLMKGSSSVANGELTGRNFHFGIREHAMGAMVNGILYHGGFRPFGATFLVFSDYMRPSIRLSALAGLPAIWVFTHDSIFVGEDGPTHQPIEHAAALRVIPNLNVFRPADGFETALAWGMALEREDGPTTILLTRQKLPAIDRRATGELADARRGAYLVDGDDAPDAIVAATGSEVHLAVAAREALARDGRKINVVSVPCLEIFLAEDESYRRRLFPEAVPVATIEAGCTDPWRVLAGLDGLTLGIDRFGASAPGKVLGERFGFTAASVTDRIRAWLDSR
ncbi:MAG: transketolase [Acidobacteriota bacterium]|nr:transketolase [Acidobacteriota bacterium]